MQRGNMHEGSARTVVLAQVIESVDTHGKLISRAEIDSVNAQVAAQTQAESAERPHAIEELLLQRAGLILQVVEGRNGRIAGLQKKSTLERAVLTFGPLLALLLGVLTHKIANPHQVDLLSPPLLLIVLWNVVVYLLLALGWARTLRPRAQGVRGPGRFRAWLGELWDGRAARQSRGAVFTAFYLQWHALTRSLQAFRIARLLHFCAAAWGLGIAISLVAGGVLARYGVEWESTFLNARQIFEFLSFLFQPVIQIFPWASFTLEDVARLEAGAGRATVMETGIGRRWVLLYVALLGMVVVGPRVLLGGWAWWREHTLAKHVAIDLSQSYFQRVTAALLPARIHLALVGHRGEDRAAMLSVLLGEAGGGLEGVPLGTGTLHTVSTDAAGGFIKVIDLPESAVPVDTPQNYAPPQGSWLEKLRKTVFGQGTPAPAAVEGDLQRAHRETDVVLHVISQAGDFGAADSLLHWLGRPVLVLINPTHLLPGERRSLIAQSNVEQGKDSIFRGALCLDEFAQCWFQQWVLIQAIARCMPEAKTTAFERLASTWREADLQRLRSSMQAIASQLLLAVRPLSVPDQPASANSGPQAREAALAAIVAQLRLADEKTMGTLLGLHGVAESQGVQINDELSATFQQEQKLTKSQVAAAGAATGAALGAGIDLLTAGLSLGMAAGAGAVLGGGAALVASSWRKWTGSHDSAPQLSDDMLMGIVEAGLLRYLCIIHTPGRRLNPDGTDPRPAWKSAVLQAVEGRGSQLKELWRTMRKEEGAKPQADLALQLEEIALQILTRLYPRG